MFCEIAIFSISQKKQLPCKQLYTWESHLATVYVPNVPCSPSILLIPFSQPNAEEYFIQIYKAVSLFGETALYICKMPNQIRLMYG